MSNFTQKTPFKDFKFGVNLNFFIPHIVFRILFNVNFLILMLIFNRPSEFFTIFFITESTKKDGLETRRIFFN